MAMEVGCLGVLLPTILLNSLLGYTIQPNYGFSTTAFYLKGVLLILVLTSCLSTVGKSAGKESSLAESMREVIRCPWCYYYSVADSNFFSLVEEKLLLLDSTVELFSLPSPLSSLSSPLAPPLSSHTTTPLHHERNPTTTDDGNFSFSTFALSTTFYPPFI